jgi:hypothetical protein
MTLIFRLFPRLARTLTVALLAVSPLAACERFSTLGFDTVGAIGSVSDADRCIDIMRRAFPEGGIDITRQEVTGGAVIVAQITGTRADIPATGPYARVVAAECRFEGGVLTDFHWTQGPVRSSNAAPTP